MKAQKNGAPWFDDQGKMIQAHGGMILEHEGIWYWYGENREHQDGSNPRRPGNEGVRAYSSRDLLHWHDEGVVLAPQSGIAAEGAVAAAREGEESKDITVSALGSADMGSIAAAYQLPAEGADAAVRFFAEEVCERPKVIYNKETKRFVLWFHLDSPDYVYAGVGVAVSDGPTGPFSMLRRMQPNRQDSRDMTLFTDVDGTVYLVHSSNWNKTLDIARLTADGTDVDGYYRSVLIDQEREAPALIYEDGCYYMLSSGCTGWAPNSALFAASRHLLGQWKLIDNPCVGDPFATAGGAADDTACDSSGAVGGDTACNCSCAADGTRTNALKDRELLGDSRHTFGAQSTWLFRAGGRIWAMFDHWKPRELAASGVSILPVTIQDGIMTISWQEEFKGI